MRLLLWSFAVSFRKTALNSDFYMELFYDFILAGQEQITPIGVNCEHHRKLLLL